MATQENGTPQEEQGPSEHSHPEPACLEAQKWIEAVTGKSFGDKDFRSALENGILLCELLSAIKPGLVKKINRLPTPIAGLDNLSVFLRGCEELGLKGAQLFDPGDLQDTSIRANLKDSDCNRKLKNVLNTVFWLGKAASGCASYSGPTLNLKEFEGLLAQMKLESEESGESSQKRSVRDSGYDCWDSERSESLSPPRHTRDNSLDSLDSFGSRSQHSPSPDVVNRGNSDGDSEADAAGKRPDVRKDDMLARRTASSEARSSVPFNQFLPNRANATTYVPGPRRKHHTEEGEQRSQTNLEQEKKPGGHFRNPKCVTWAPDNSFNQREKPILEDDEAETQEAMEQKKIQKLQKAGIKVLPAAVRYNSPAAKEEPEVRSPSPNIILRRDNEFLRTQKAAWDSSSDNEEVETQKMPDVRKDDLASRRAARGPAPKVQQFVPPPVCSNKDLERWEGIRRASQQTLQERENSDKEMIPDIITRRENPFLKPAPRTDQEESEEDEEEEAVKTVPNKQKDDLALRRSQSRPLPHRDGPMSFASAPMSQADMQKWERLKMSDPRSASMGDILNEDEVGHLPHISPSRYERMQEQYSSFKEDENQWQDDLARWKNRRRSASQDLIKKEEERKMIEKKMKEESDRRKSIKTYKEIIEEKERREAELCEAYRNAATPEEAAMVLQRYALRFTISDATLDSLKVPRPVVAATDPDHEQTDKDLKPSTPVKDEDLKVSEQHKMVIKTDNKHNTEHVELTKKQEDIVCLSSIPTPPTSPVKSPERALPLLPEKPVSKPAESQSTVQPQRAPVVQSQAKIPSAPSPLQRTQTLPTTPVPPPPSRPVPLLAAKPWSSQAGNKSFKMDGLVRVNGEAAETSSIRTPPLSPMRSPEGAKPATPASPPTPVSPMKPDKEAPCEQTVSVERTVQPPSHSPPQTERPQSATSSAISSLIGGRNCIITTTIVTELTHVEPVTPERHTNGQVNGTSTFTQEPVEEQRSPLSPLTNSMQDFSPTTTEAVEDGNLTTETPMLNLAKRVNHWVWDPNEERKRLERWQQEQERLLQEQYEKEQEKLKKEWERAQLEVEEEERKHNEEERRILEETVAPLNPTGILSQPDTQTNITSPTEVTKAPSSIIPLQHNGHKVPLGNEGQHASKLHFFQDSTCEVEASRKQELLKTESLDHSPQPKQPQNVKRSGSHDTAVGRQQSHPSPHPPSPSRCVSGKRLCSGCSQPLGKGAAMIIDTLGLFFHMQCFKCGVCDGQLGDATAGTDVRIRNGQLSCHECYIASRGRGQPTTL
ncbi:LIM and calponin homology domains-containing protein 1-like isoform X2 [Boleophthalmus pectinirostris]|uniref:LIM and calponin homology domains-containing protein 1-like isoform X2 n=1 Tax=Boleophthalmus pectinirostris TaxID=150288 RepID=UPI0024316EEC|nr:LIM and calponin homology domains-containing protein 1-like isoform X2 [Boleophthalmus pectinirostris]